MIVGLSGYARSGKDEVAKVLVEEYGFKRIAFADKIRELLFEMDPPLPVGVSTERHIVGLQNFVEIYGWDESKKHPNVRAMLQNLGVGARNVFGEEFWIAQALRQVHFTENWVITDVRFKNEAEAIKEYDDAQLWRVKRVGVEAVNDHISEHDLDDYHFDQILKNEGTLEDFHQKVRNRMEFTLNAN